MSSSYLNSNCGFGELNVNFAMLEQYFVGGSLPQNEHLKFNLVTSNESHSFSQWHETESRQRPAISTSPSVGTCFSDQEPSTDHSSFHHTSSIFAAPICRQFWRAGTYDDLHSKPTYQNTTDYLSIHPRFLHSNATSHKWVFGAMAELIDNAVDEIQNGATFVFVDRTLNARDGTPVLLIQDDGGGMDPEAMRHCLSFGFSAKNSNTVIGRYGNGFKTSSMRLGADVIVFSRCMRNGKCTQSVGLLSYSFLMQTGQDRIVVPMVDYEFDAHSGVWNALQNEKQLENNLSILLQWSPFTTQTELLKQCDGIGFHGTKLIVYNLWHNDEGDMELDFDSDPEDILISGKHNSKKVSLQKEANKQHLANRLKYSLRAYLSILYLRVFQNFRIILRDQRIEYHNIASDLKFPEFIMYRPQNVEGLVLTTIGFLKEAEVNVHGFNVYHKNRLIMPFWPVVSCSSNRGRGVVGVLEANFMEPTHNKQDFERTPAFQKLEIRLKDMTNEYWNYHCGLIGYSFNKIKAPQSMLPPGSNLFVIGTKKSYEAGVNGQNGCASLYQNSTGESLKGKEIYNALGSEMEKRMVVEVPGATGSADGGVAQHVVNPAKQLQGPEASRLIRQNKRLHAQFQEYEKTDKELNLKLLHLAAQVEEAKQEHAGLLLQLYPRLGK